MQIPPLQQKVRFVESRPPGFGIFHSRFTVQPDVITPSVVPVRKSRIGCKFDRSVTTSHGPKICDTIFPLRNACELQVRGPTQRLVLPILLLASGHRHVAAEELHAEAIQGGEPGSTPMSRIKISSTLKLVAKSWYAARSFRNCQCRHSHPSAPRDGQLKPKIPETPFARSNLSKCGQ